MDNIPMKPTHPGVLFKRRIYDCLDNFRKERVVKSIEDIDHFFVGKCDVNYNTARELALLTNTSVDLWLNLQFNYDNWMAQYGPFEE